jgi:glycerol-3-phosphate dehydrogenase (NAD(P)+)
MTSTRIAVIGDGGWGTTLAVLLAKKEYGVTLWSPFDDYAAVLKETRINSKFLPSVKIPGSIEVTCSQEQAVQSADVIVYAVPSMYMRHVLNGFRHLHLEDRVVVSVTKGIENETLLRMSEVIAKVTGCYRIVVMSGPTIAFEVARGIPTTVVVASPDENDSRRIQDLFMTESFRVYTSDDVTGVELGGALKNVIAIAAGISDGLGFGTNAKSALVTRGLVEIARLGVKMGAQAQTFYGLSGLGDLVTTCINPHGRNRFVGEQIGKGKKLEEIVGGMEMVAEGVTTAKSVRDLALKYAVDMPITQEVYSVLFENKDPLIAVRELMQRSPKAELVSV